MSISLLIGCTKEDDSIPKPLGYVRLEYPHPQYQWFQPNCPFTLEYSKWANIQTKTENNCWYNFNYPKMKGTIYLTYIPVNNNLPKLIKESQRLVYEHTIKANSIKAKSFSFPAKHVYGNLYRLGGESASNIQFYITDNTQHFISGNVYFRTQPKPDSLKPAVDYLERDVVRMIESIKWK